jgi:hypothetical protein
MENMKKGKLNSEIIWKIWKISVLVIITPKTPPPHAPPSLLLRGRPPPPLLAPLPSSSSSSAAAAAAAIALKFQPKHVTNINKTKHIMKISHIGVNIYDKTASSQENSD